jgi:hypothetical protein
MQIGGRTGSVPGKDLPPSLALGLDQDEFDY